MITTLFYQNAGQGTDGARGEEQTKQPSQPQTERKQSGIYIYQNPISAFALLHRNCLLGVQTLHYTIITQVKPQMWQWAKNKQSNLRNHRLKESNQVYISKSHFSICITTVCYKPCIILS